LITDGPKHGQTGCWTLPGGNVTGLAAVFEMLCFFSVDFLSGLTPNFILD